MQRDFPRLLASRPVVTSFWTDRFNCIAWAAGDTERWWWPDEYGQSYWPPGVPRNVALPAFIEAFGTLGYQPCSMDQRDASMERVALFASEVDEPTHAARLLPSGNWTSKLGEQIDIEHELTSVEGPSYGRVAAVLQREWPRANGASGCHA